MKFLKQITSYELWFYGAIEDMDVEYIQFDSTMHHHRVGEITTLKKLYEDWNDNGREDGLFTALIKWVDRDSENTRLIICLAGTDGKLHYED